MFMKTITAGTLAVSLTLTGLTPTTASAQISNDDALAGIVTLLLLGAAIHNSNDRDDNRRPTGQPTRDWRVLPESCQRGVNLRNGDRLEMLNRQCINQTYAYADRLPQSCHVQVRAANGEYRAGYRIGCLRNQGFRISRH